MPVTIEGEPLPTEVSYNAELQSGQDPGEDDEHADDIPAVIMTVARSLKTWDISGIVLCGKTAHIRVPPALSAPG